MGCDGHRLLISKMAQRRRTIDKGEIRIVDDMNVIFSRVIRLMSDIYKGALMHLLSKEFIHMYVYFRRMLVRLLLGLAAEHLFIFTYKWSLPFPKIRASLVINICIGIVISCYYHNKAGYDSEISSFWILSIDYFLTYVTPGLRWSVTHRNCDRGDRGVINAWCRGGGNIL